MIEEHDIENPAQLGTARHHLKVHLKALSGNPRKEAGEVDNGQLQAGCRRSVAIVDLHRAVYDCGTGAR